MATNVRSQKIHDMRVQPTQLWDEKVRQSPIAHTRIERRDNAAVITSGFAGKFMPLKMIPLFREDGVLNSRLTVQFQMAELSNMILNPVRATAMAYLVPKMAFERFKDMGQIDRSYNGIEESGGSVIPWFDMYTPDTQPRYPEFYEKLGIHWPDGGAVNTDYIEAYNCVWNYIARQRSASLELRDRLDETIAPAFWEHTQMKHVKPTFDDALMDGRVPLTFSGGTQQLPVYSKGVVLGGDRRGPAGDASEIPPGEAGRWDWTGIVWSELQENSVEVSIANIDLARETKAWARLRNQFEGVSEEYLMDQLLQGIRIADEGLREPILLSHADTIFGLNERYATDGDNLDVSVADGNTAVTLNLRTPPVPCGGVVVVCAQVLPEQVYERQRDYYFTAESVEDLPNRTADELDPQPVHMVKNGDVDQKHSLPDDLFGYEPLNARWMRSAPNVGGKFYRPDPDGPWDEDRNRIWDTNVVDPALGTDFYLASNIRHDVFKSSNEDPFEFWVSGIVRIGGLTYFGPALMEGSDDYEKVLEQVDTSRLKGDGSDAQV